MAVWDDAPAVLIFGDSEEGIVMASETTIASGGRIAAALPIAQASDRLEGQIAVDLVIVDVSIDHGPVLDRLFRQIEDAAGDHRFSSVVTIVPELVDVTAARIGHLDVSVLVGRDSKALAQAMANGLARAGPQLREEDVSDKGVRRPASDGGMPRDGFGVGEGPIYDSCHDLPASGMALVAEDLEAPDPSLIRGMIRARRLRNQLFGPGLFADPAWDILLDLMAARVEGRSVAVSSLCIAAAVPATTALRWIRQLTEMGLLHRVADPLDGRRVFIELTKTAVVTLTGYFNTLDRGNFT